MKLFLAVSFGLAIPLSVGVHAAYVTVGNPGNSDDVHGDGFGGVPYTYQISEYEVTAGEYATFLNAVDPTGANPNNVYSSLMDTDNYGCQITWNDGSSTYDFSGRPSGGESDWTNRPVNYVSWYDAARYTNWLTAGNTATGVYSIDSSDPDPNNWSVSMMEHQLAAVTYGTAYFIPTEDEWYKAAYYDPSGVYYNYPTGSDTLPGYVNSGNLSGGGIFVEGGTDPGNYATYVGAFGMDGVGPDYYRTNVGEWENSASPWGTFDQGGNVREWNETDIFGDGTRRGCRGGFFAATPEQLHAVFRMHNPTATERADLGFRVASLTAVPEPASFVLLTLAGLEIIARRRRGA